MVRQNQVICFRWSNIYLLTNFTFKIFKNYDFTLNEWIKWIITNELKLWSKICHVGTTLLFTTWNGTKRIKCLHSGCSDDLLTLITDSTEPTRTKFAVVENEEHKILAHLNSIQVLNTGRIIKWMINENGFILFINRKDWSLWSVTGKWLPFSSVKATNFHNDVRTISFKYCFN